MFNLQVLDQVKKFVEDNDNDHKKKKREIFLREVRIKGSKKSGFKLCHMILTLHNCP